MPLNYGTNVRLTFLLDRLELSLLSELREFFNENPMMMCETAKIFAHILILTIYIYIQSLRSDK